MKTGIHPELKPTKVNCLGCGEKFESISTVSEISVDVCSNCHPFYTGKQKLVDTAGRVDRFQARSEAAKKNREKLSNKALKANKRLEAKIAKSKATQNVPTKKVNNSTPKSTETKKPVTPVTKEQ